MATAGELYLKIRRSSSAAVQTFHFPVVDQISEDITVTLSELPTIVFGVRNRFDMDMGTMQKFTFKVTRINPFPWDDSSRASCDEWSNGHFYTELIDAIDFWQNFAYNDQGEYTGGFEATFISSDETQYPSFVKNVFLSGQFTPDYSVQKMTFSLPLVVASMTGSSAQVDMVNVTLHANNGTSETQVVQVPKNYEYPVPSYPSDWTNNGLGTAGWDTSPAGTTVVYRAGETFIAQEDMDLYLVWQRPFAYHAWTEASTDWEYTIPANAATISIIIVGGGGCGGYGRSTNGSGSMRSYFIPGGAGGSGYVEQASRTVFPGDVLKFEIGQPGHWDGSNKVAPTASILYHNGVEIARANPGENGHDTESSDLAENRGGLGGQYDCEGGCSTFVPGSTMYADFKGEAGTSRDGLGTPGSGTEGTGGGTSVFRYMVCGGGGGAAAAFDVQVQTTSMSGVFSTASVGGDGFTLNYVDKAAPNGGNNGFNGGGGGAGIRSASLDVGGAGAISDPRGADGGYGACVVTVFEEM